MSCNDKIKHSCGTKVFAVCTEYQGATPAFSSLTEGCLDVEEVIGDVYGILGGIKEDLNLSGLINGCVAFSSPKTLQSVLEEFHAKLCELEDTVVAQAVTISTQAAQITALQENNCV